VVGFHAPSGVDHPPWDWERPAPAVSVRPLAPSLVDRLERDGTKASRPWGGAAHASSQHDSDRAVMLHIMSTTGWLVGFMSVHELSLQGLYGTGSATTGPSTRRESINTITLKAVGYTIGELKGSTLPLHVSALSDEANLRLQCNHVAMAQLHETGTVKQSIPISGSRCTVSCTRVRPSLVVRLYSFRHVIFHPHSHPTPPIHRL
jgi:hypothetical protein